MVFDSLSLVLSQVQVAPGEVEQVAWMPRGRVGMRVEGRSRRGIADHSMCAEELLTQPISACADAEEAGAQGEEQRPGAGEDNGLQPGLGAAERTDLRQVEDRDLCVCSCVCKFGLKYQGFQEICLNTHLKY